MLVYFYDCRPLAALMMMGDSSKPMSLFKVKPGGYFWHFLAFFDFVFCFLFSPEDGSSMAVETCWLFKNLYRLEIRVKYLN